MFLWEASESAGVLLHEDEIASLLPRHTVPFLAQIFFVNKTSRGRETVSVLLCCVHGPERRCTQRRVLSQLRWIHICTAQECSAKAEDTIEIDEAAHGTMELAYHFTSYKKLENATILPLLV